MSEFMSRGYDLIEEPLNLREGGRRWFTAICDAPGRGVQEHALVLGATTWIIELLQRTHRRVTAVDMSETMIDRARLAAPAVNFVRASWRDMPAPSEPFDTVVTDNAFSYLPFPDGWSRLCDDLSSTMRPGARLVARVLSVPDGHRAETAEQIAARFSTRAQFTFTELRAALLFAHWRRETGAIDTEAVLRSYEENAAHFAPFLGRIPPGQPNDLVTVEKYRGAGAVYYAPPLDEWLALVRGRFRVESVHFGPYPMSEYFPLVAALRA